MNKINNRKNKRKLNIFAQKISSKQHNSHHSLSLHNSRKQHNKMHDNQKSFKSTKDITVKLLQNLMFCRQTMRSIAQSLGSINDTILWLTKIIGISFVYCNILIWLPYKWRYFISDNNGDNIFCGTSSVEVIFYIQCNYSCSSNFFNIIITTVTIKMMIFS